MQEIGLGLGRRILGREKLPMAVAGHLLVGVILAAAEVVVVMVAGLGPDGVAFLPRPWIRSLVNFPVRVGLMVLLNQSQ